MIDLNQIEDNNVMGFIPQTTAIARVTEGKVAKDKNGVNYIRLDCELVSPDEVAYTDKDGKAQVALVASRKCGYFLFLGPKGISRVKEFHKALGLPMSIDPANPDTTIYVDIAFSCIINSKVDAKIDGTTGRPIVDPTTGQVVNNVNINISQVFALAPEYTVPASV